MATTKVRPLGEIAVQVVISHDGLNAGEVFVTEVDPWILARLAAGYLVEVPRGDVPSDQGGAV